MFVIPDRPVLAVVSNNAIVDKRAGKSHCQLLCDVAARIGGKMVETVSAGDCSSHAICFARSDNALCTMQRKDTISHLEKFRVMTYLVGHLQPCRV